MTSKRALVIWAHPRIDSLTAAVTADVRVELRDKGFDVDELDLYRAGFGADLREPDEPVWDDVDHRFSPEVMELAARTKAADAVVFVFPVWWYSFPALMKGYIDRVWNYGLIYGEGRRADIAAVRWIGLAGEREESFRKRGYVEMMEHYLNVGIAGFCGVGESRVELLYNTLGEGIGDPESHFAALRAQARNVVRELAVSLQPAGALSQASAGAGPDDVAGSGVGGPR